MSSILFVGLVGVLLVLIGAWLLSQKRQLVRDVAPAGNPTRKRGYMR